MNRLRGKKEQELREILKGLIDQSLNDTEIAKETGVSADIIIVARQWLGLELKKKISANAKLSSRMRQIEAAILEGAGTHKAIGQKIGVSRESVRQILRKNRTTIPALRQKLGIVDTRNLPRELRIIEENSQLITTLAGEGKNEEIFTTDSEQKKVRDLAQSLGLKVQKIANGPRFLLACVAVIYSKAEDIHAVAYPRVIYITRKNTTAVVENIAASQDKVTMTSIAEKLIGDEVNNLAAKQVNLNFTTKALCELFGIRKAGEVAKTGTGEGNNWNALTTFLREQKPEGMIPEDYAEKVWRYAVSKEVLKANLRPLLKIARLQRDRTSAYQRLAELLKSPLKGDLDAQEKRAERFIRVCKTRVEKISARKAVQKEATDPTEAVKTSEAAISA